MNSNQKVALVTGASKGIGYGIAEQLLLDGYAVAITSRTYDNAQTCAHVLAQQTGGDCKGFSYDMSAAQAPQQLISQVLAHWGSLHILVNNALDNTINAPFLTVPDEVVAQAIYSNMGSVVALCKHAYPSLQASRGCIVMVGSSVTNRYVNGLPLYAMAKAGLQKFIQALAADWADQGVRLNVVNPGFTHSGAAKDLGLSDEQIAGLYSHLERFQPLGAAQPQDIAAMVNFLVSPKAHKITGAVLDVDGGHHIQGHALFPQ